MALARARQLLERHGVLTREAALAEGVEGGFAGVYPVLRAMEDKGTVRRGYFVAGLGAAQFALPGAVDRLRAERDPAASRRSPVAAPASATEPNAVGGLPADVAGGAPVGLGSIPAEDRGWSGGEGPGSFGGGWDDPGLDDDAAVRTIVLAATDPAQPYGAALPWPETSGRPARAAGAHVVLVDGRPLAYLERGGRSVSLFPGAAGRVVDDGPGGPASRITDATGASFGAPDADGAEGDARWVDALAGLVRSGRRRSVEIAKVDGLPVRETDAAELLRAAGFSDSYRGLVLRSR